jgi:serine/threonine-protein kinase
MLSQILRQRDTEMLPIQIGNYRIIGKLGKGGMGDIYKAVQEPLNRVVALKVLSPQLSRDEEFSKRFEIEAKAISMLQHQNIVNIYEYGEEDGLRFFAMQFVDGSDLGRYIYDNKMLPIGEIIDFSKQICRGLRYAHSCNVVHRDIKPQNVLIDKNGVARLSDFGIAKIFSGTEITLTGSAVGTPEYMSPEQAQGKKLDLQTDVYSLGIVMYEMLTRRPPFTGNNPMSVAYKQVHELPIPPSMKRKDTPKRLELIILKAIKKDRRERYTSVEEMLNHLDSVDPQERVQHPTIFLRSKKKNEPVEDSSESDRRITDRRSGNRRRDGEADMFSKDYWIDMVRYNWINWLMTGAIGGVLLYHLLTSN